MHGMVRSCGTVWLSLFGDENNAPTGGAFRRAMSAINLLKMIINNRVYFIFLSFTLKFLK